MLFRSSYGYIHEPPRQRLKRLIPDIEIKEHRGPDLNIIGRHFLYVHRHGAVKPGSRAAARHITVVKNVIGRSWSKKGVI